MRITNTSYFPWKWNPLSSDIRWSWIFFSAKVVPSAPALNYIIGAIKVGPTSINLHLANEHLIKTSKQAHKNDWLSARNSLFTSTSFSIFSCRTSSLAVFKPSGWALVNCFVCNFHACTISSHLLLKTERGRWCSCEFLLGLLCERINRSCS